LLPCRKEKILEGEKAVKTSYGKEKVVQSRYFKNTPSFARH